MKLITTIKELIGSFRSLFTSKKRNSYSFNLETEKKIKEINKEMEELFKKYGGK